MNTAQKLARSGGPALGEAMKFVTICRALDPQNDYPHIGDLQWWCRDGSLDDQQNWHFWYQESGEALALGIVAGDEIVCLLHPDFRTPERYRMVHQWAVHRVKERARQQGENQYEIEEQTWGLATGDDLGMVRFLEREGFERQEMSYHCYRRPLIEPVPAPILPTGFTIRPVAGEAEAEMRAALHRDAFFPRLRERGMQAALVTGAHPGNEEKSTEFTSSRFVYEAVGFQLLCRTYLYHKVFATTV